MLRFPSLSLVTVILAAFTPSLFADVVAGSPVVPVQQRGTEKRHAAKVEAIKANKYDLLTVGDSITQNLEKPEYKAVWDHFFAPRNAIDLGL